MADFNYKEFKYKGKDIQYEGNTFITDITVNTSYKRGNVFTYNGVVYIANKDFTSDSSISVNIGNNDISPVSLEWSNF